MEPTPSEINRFKSKFDVSKAGCHVWNGPLDKDGYGTFFFRRAPRRAHRVAMFYAGTPVGAGMVTHHTCGNRACVNPQHLSAVTPAQNTLNNSNSVGAVNAQKTTCKNGHPFDKKVKTKQGFQRICSICEKEKSKRLRAKWRSQDPLKGII